MKQEQRFILINDIIKAIQQTNLHSTPSAETLKLINELRTNDKVFEEKIDNFIKESRDDRQRIFEQVKKINGSVACISKFKERAIGSISTLKMLFVPVILSIVILYLEKFLK